MALKLPSGGELRFAPRLINYFRGPRSLLSSIESSHSHSFGDRNPLLFFLYPNITMF